MDFIEQLDLIREQMSEPSTIIIETFNGTAKLTSIDHKECNGIFVFTGPTVADVIRQYQEAE